MWKITFILSLLLLSSCTSKIVGECDCDGQVSLKNVSVEDCNKICKALNHKCVDQFANGEIDCDDCIENFKERIDAADAGY